MFHILAESTTADANDLNDNWKHIADGDRLPRDGNSLTVADATYDLGSSTTTWNNLFCNNLNISQTLTTADKSLWIPIWEGMTVTALGGGFYKLDISGLNGDEDLEYRFKFKSNVTWTPLMYFNGDSSASYGMQLLETGYINGANQTQTAIRITSSTAIYFSLNSGTSVYVGHWDFTINAKTGMPRMIIGDWSYVDFQAWINIGNVSGVWNNTSDTLTSIQIICQIPISQILFQLWKRG
jgi:hypothetical protein